MTLWTVAHQASLSYTISQSLFKLLSIESVITSDHLILCLPLLFLPSIFPSIRVFSSELALHIRWPKFGCFSFSISPSNDIQILFPLGLPGLISLLSMGLWSLLQHHNSKASVLQHPVFFMVQRLYSYTATGKTIALTIRNFVSKVMSLLFNMLSTFVIAFLPRNKHVLISWLQSPFTVILEPKKIKLEGIV